MANVATRRTSRLYGVAVPATRHRASGDVLVALAAVAADLHEHRHGAADGSFTACGRLRPTEVDRVAGGENGP